MVRCEENTLGLTSAAQHIGLTWADIAHPLCNIWRGACLYNTWRGARSKTLQTNIEKSLSDIEGTWSGGDDGESSLAGDVCGLVRQLCS